MSRPATRWNNWYDEELMIHLASHLKGSLTGMESVGKGEVQFQDGKHEFVLKR